MIPVINTGSTTYSEVNPGAVNAGIHPAGYTNVTEGMIISELPNGDIDICRYDTYRNLEIGANRHWVLKAPFDGSKFEYADVRDADDNPNGVSLWNGLPAPVFTKSAEIIVKPTAFDATATIPQLPTMNVYSATEYVSARGEWFFPRSSSSRNST